MVFFISDIIPHLSPQAVSAVDVKEMLSVTKSKIKHHTGQSHETDKPLYCMWPHVFSCTSDGNKSTGKCQ